MIVSRTVPPATALSKSGIRAGIVSFIIDSVSAISPFILLSTCSFLLVVVFITNAGVSSNKSPPNVLYLKFSTPFSNSSKR